MSHILHRAWVMTDFRHFCIAVLGKKDGSENQYDFIPLLCDRKPDITPVPKASVRFTFYRKRNDFCTILSTDAATDFKNDFFFSYKISAMFISSVVGLAIVIMYLAILCPLSWGKITPFSMYSVWVAISYVMLCCIQLNWTLMEASTRKLVANFIYFAMMSVASWLHVISFEVWQSFR